MKKFLILLVASFLLINCSKEEEFNSKKPMVQALDPVVMVSTFAGTTVLPIAFQNNGYNNGLVATFLFPTCGAPFPDGTILVMGSYVPATQKVSSNGSSIELSGNSEFISPYYPGWGYVDGIGTAARYNNPKGFAPGPDGNVYMADTFNRRIRQVDITGFTKTVAGSGVEGYIDGTATTAQFKEPNAICVTNLGIKYVADKHRVRKIDLDGNVTTVAGSVLAGNTLGNIAVARFRDIEGITTDNQNLYISDTGNNVVKKINLTTGQVTLITVSGLITPSGILFKGGNLFVSDRYGNKVFKIDSAGTSSVYAGTGSPEFKDGLANIAKFNQPEQLLSYGSDILVIDRNNHRVRRISTN